MSLPQISGTEAQDRGLEINVGELLNQNSNQSAK